MLLYEALESTGFSSYQSVHTPLSKGVATGMNFETSSSQRVEMHTQLLCLSHASIAPQAALTECLESVGWSRRVLPGCFSQAS